MRGDILAKQLSNSVSSDDFIEIQNQSTRQPSRIPATLLTGGHSSGGSVTSVALSLPNIFSVSGSPITSAGTLSASLVNQDANTVLAGPTAGGAATPAFRALVANDIPDLSATYQPKDATLTALANANWAANSMFIGSGADAGDQVTFAANTIPGRSSAGNLVAKTCTDFAFSFLDDADAAAGRTTLGLGTGDSPEFTAVNIGHASDTTITRVAAGRVAVEGVELVRQGQALGTPSSGTLTNCTGLPVSSGISGLAANVAAFLATPSSANLRGLLTDENGTGAALFDGATSPTFAGTANFAGLSASADALIRGAAGTAFAGTVGVAIGGTAPAVSFEGTSNPWLIYKSGDSLRIYQNSAGVDRFVIDSAGNVGVGITPRQKLEVAGSSPRIWITSSNNTDFRGFGFATTADATEYGSLAMALTNGEVRQTCGFASWGGFYTVYTNGAEQFRIDTSGNVGIATTNPGEKLDVNGNVRAATSLIAAKSVLLEDVYALSAVGGGGTASCDAANGDVQTLRATGHFTLNITGPAGKACRVRLHIWNDSGDSVNVSGGTGWSSSVSSVVLGTNFTRVLVIEWDGAGGWLIANVNGSAAGDKRPT